MQPFGDTQNIINDLFHYNLVVCFLIGQIAAALSHYEFIKFKSG